MKLFNSKNLLVILFSLLVLVLVVVITLNYSDDSARSEDINESPTLLRFNSSFGEAVILDKINLKPYTGIRIYKNESYGLATQKRFVFKEGKKKEVVDLNKEGDTLDYYFYDDKGTNHFHVHNNKDTLSKTIALNSADSLVAIEFMEDFRAKNFTKLLQKYTGQIGEYSFDKFNNCLRTVFVGETDSFSLVKAIKELSFYKDETRVDLSYILRCFIGQDSVDLLFTIFNSQKEPENPIGLRFISKNKSFIKSFYDGRAKNDTSVEAIKDLKIDNQSFKDKFLKILPKDIADYEMTYFGFQTFIESPSSDFVETLTFRNGIILFNVNLFYRINDGVCYLNSASIVKPSLFQPLWRIM